MLTDVAPVTVQNKVDGLPELIADGLLLKVLITGSAPTGGSGAELTLVTADPVTVPAELVAVKVYTVGVAGDTSLIPAKSTWPIPWSMLTDVAPVTFQNKTAELPELIADGLLPKAPITGSCPAGGVVANGEHPGMRMSNNSSDKERKTTFFNVVTSKNILPATSTRP
jgi:hypothetical protein